MAGKADARCDRVVGDGVANLDVGVVGVSRGHARPAGARQGDAPQPDPHRGAVVERTRLRRGDRRGDLLRGRRRPHHLLPALREQGAAAREPRGRDGGGVATDLDEAHDAESLDEQLDVLIRGISRRMQAVPKSLAQLVINSQRLGAHEGGSARCSRELDPLRRPGPGGAGRRPPTGRAGARPPTPRSSARSSARSRWTRSRRGRRDDPKRSLTPVLRFRFALVVDQPQQSGDELTCDQSRRARF